MLSLGDYVCPPTTFFSPTLLAASRESGKQSGRLENVILLTEEGKNTLCSRTPAVHSLAAFHFPTAEFPGRERETEWSSVASKAKRPLARSLAPLSPAKANSPGHAFLRGRRRGSSGRSMSSEKRFLSCVMVASSKAPRVRCSSMFAQDKPCR